MNLTVDINAMGADENMNVYDSFIRFKVDVTNHADGDYTRYLLAPIFIVDENDHGTMISYQNVAVNIPAGATQTFYFDFDNLAFGSRYALNIYGRNENDVTTNLVPPGGSKFYTVNRGLVTWTSDGVRMGHNMSGDVTIPEDAVAVSFEDIDVTSVVPNSNPNTLYYIATGEKTIPNGLEGKNVIKNYIAQGDIVIKHGYDFFAPFRFKADNISYERKFNKGRHAGQAGGWSTMVLPFAATSVTADGAAIDWMHSKTDAKGLWVCNFNEEEDTADDAKLLAGYVGNTLEANVPYFVAPYDGANGTDMRGKTFLNAAGSHFVKADNGTVNAFEVYADDVMASNASQLQIVLDENAEQASSSLRGDVDSDGQVDMDDLSMLINYLLAGDASGIDMEAADCEPSGEVNMDDLSMLINYLLTNSWD